jgi:dTDP-4-dehydrorhamnose reductase
MAKQKIAILGCTGMLGSIVLDSFAKSGEFEVVATYRTAKTVKLVKNRYPGVDFCRLDVEKTNLKGILAAIDGAGWVINAIGVIKPYIHDDNNSEINRAIQVNVYFPYLLARAIENVNSKVIQIATDCVYSGQKGHYKETDPHDALDVYGKTKSLGEVYGKNYYHLRCSIIGPELKGHSSLLDWFLSQPKDAKVNGFVNHQWNGVTVLHFARICRGIIQEKLDLPHTQHIVPANSLSKAELLKSVAKEFKRKDIIIDKVEAPIRIDRTLSTKNKILNQKIWQSAGYKNPPSIQRMVKELARL